MSFWDSRGNELSYGLIAFIIGFALLFIFAFLRHYPLAYGMKFP